MNKILEIVVLGFLLSVNAFAKTSNLKDINTFQLSINEFDKCDVDTDDLKTSAKYVAANSDINLIDFTTSWNEILEITLMIQQAVGVSPEICVGYLRIEAGRFVVSPNTKGFGGPAPTIYYKRAEMFGSDTDRFKNKVINNFERMMKDFVIELKDSR